MPHFKFNMKLLSVETHSGTVNRKCTKTLLKSSYMHWLSTISHSFLQQIASSQDVNLTTCYHATEIPKDQVSITERRPMKNTQKLQKKLASEQFKTHIL